MRGSMEWLPGRSSWRGRLERWSPGRSSWRDNLKIRAASAIVPASGAIVLASSPEDIGPPGRSFWWTIAPAGRSSCWTIIAAWQSLKGAAMTIVHVRLHGMAAVTIVLARQAWEVVTGTIVLARHPEDSGRQGDRPGETSLRWGRQGDRPGETA